MAPCALVGGALTAGVCAGGSGDTGSPRAALLCSTLHSAAV